jgi:F-type H+-transporting ATPase subunit epsilon
MNLKILLPFDVFVEKTEVSRIVAESRDSSFGLYPNRLDCTVALVPGILFYETKSDGEVFLAIDEGVLVKTGRNVLVSVRRAIAGADLDRLRASVENEFQKLDDMERSARSAMAKLETGFLRRFAGLQHG